MISFSETAISWDSLALGLCPQPCQWGLLLPEHGTDGTASCKLLGGLHCAAKNQPSVLPTDFSSYTCPNSLHRGAFHVWEGYCSSMQMLTHKNHRIVESPKLEKASKITQATCPPVTNWTCGSHFAVLEGFPCISLMVIVLFLAGQSNSSKSEELQVLGGDVIVLFVSHCPFTWWKNLKTDNKGK